MVNPTLGSTPANGPDPITLRMAADHEEIDGLFGKAGAALDRRLSLETHTLLDRVWMRLAVHIRAEHKVIFPVLMDTRPDLHAHLQGLREDHDFFMAALAEAVKALQGPSPDFDSIKKTVAAVRLRLTPHNALEEEQIYPALDLVPEAHRGRIFAEVSQELTFLPKRYEP